MNEELQELLRLPREDLHIELKQWMDPSDRNVQAKFAKELLALRNHGGGFLVIGFKDAHPPVPDPNRPESLDGYSADAMNNIVKRYAEPGFHCTSSLVEHPESGELFPVVQVPGGAKVPVRCKSDSPDGGKSAKVDTYYIRRPGPESNSPQSGAEWDDLLRRCLANQRDELLSAFAAVIGAENLRPASLGGALPLEDKFAVLREFQSAAVLKLEQLQAGLGGGNPARFEHGKLTMSARLVGDLKPVSTTQLLFHMSSLPSYTGWSPMYIFSREEIAPYPVEDELVECWLGRDQPTDTAHADFWRASSKGLFTLIRGYKEDEPSVAKTLGSPGVGLGIELTRPVWMYAEFLLRVRALGALLIEGPFIIQLEAKWEGLAGRRLFSFNNRRSLRDGWVCRSDSFSVTSEVESDVVDAALPQHLEAALGPLFRRFGFFEPPRTLYSQELAKLQGK